MIIATVNHAHEKVICTFLVHIDRPNNSAKEFSKVALKNTTREAETWANSEFKKFLQKEIKSFLTQRTIALKQVGVFNTAIEQRINSLKRIAEQPTLTAVCQFIIKHQTDIRLMVPSSTSNQHYWTYEIEAMISAAHSFIMYNKSIIEKFQCIN
jgi:hypothetical protein